MDELNNILCGMSDSVANLQLPDPDLRDFYVNEQDRVYYIDMPIGENTLDLVKFILKCNKEDAGKPVEERKRILVMIDSPGGSVEVLGSVIGAMKISKTPIWTCYYCTAFSAAADLLACGHKRFALPMTAMMFHAGSAVYQGTQNEIDKAKKFFDGIGKRINDEVYSRANFDAKTIKKMKTDDVYLTEEDAVKCGVIDEIITDMDKLF